MSNFVIWVSDLRILNLVLLCLWFGFAMLSFGFFFFCGIRERARPDRHHQGKSKTSLGLLCCASVLMWEAREEKKKKRVF